MKNNESKYSLARCMCWLYVQLCTFSSRFIVGTTSLWTTCWMASDDWGRTVLSTPVALWRTHKNVGIRGGDNRGWTLQLCLHAPDFNSPQYWKPWSYGGLLRLKYWHCCQEIGFITHIVKLHKRFLQHVFVKIMNSWVMKNIVFMRYV